MNDYFGVTLSPTQQMVAINFPIFSHNIITITTKHCTVWFVHVQINWNFGCVCFRAGWLTDWIWMTSWMARSKTNKNHNKQTNVYTKKSCRNVRVCVWAVVKHQHPIGFRWSDQWWWWWSEENVFKTNRNLVDMIFHYHLGWWSSFSCWCFHLFIIIIITKIEINSTNLKKKFFKIFIQNEKNSLGDDDDDDNGNKLTSWTNHHQHTLS